MVMKISVLNHLQVDPDQTALSRHALRRDADTDRHVQIMTSEFSLRFSGGHLQNTDLDQSQSDNQ